MIRVAVALAAIGPGCASDEGERGAEVGEAPFVPPPESCSAPSIAEPQKLAPCTTGGGIFGAWTIDDLGLVAYDYGLDQDADARALRALSDGTESRSHWAAFGNDRVNAMASNDGFVELVTQDRGVLHLNKVGVNERALGGGFGWIDDGGEVWSTAYKLRPRGAKTRRRFGMGYAEAETTHRDVRVLRRTFAPEGDAPLVLDEVILENLSDAPKTIAHYEYWDVARRPIEINWLVSGQLPQAAKRAAEARDAQNQLFVEHAEWSADDRIASVRRRYVGPPRPARDVPDAVQRYAEDPFLAQVVGETSRVFTDEAAFFGEGGPKAPDAIVHDHASDVAGAERSAFGQSLAFVLRSDVSLAPGEKKLLRFAYGYAREGEPVPLRPEYRDASRDLRRENADALRGRLLWLATPDRASYLHRELAWHASQLEASRGFREYWGKHVVPQGSAYLYLHGADGALRDTALFAMPLVYTRPEQAKEQLLLTMELAHADDSRFSYAFQGNGVLDDALNIHRAPSDLDLFFLLAIVEYLSATGDLAILEERVSYWPRSPENEATVLAHVTRAVRHLFDVVGTGEHGLLRVGTGDWSDGIVFKASDRKLAVEKGESVPNTQMALHVLPLVADLLDAREPALASEIRSRLAPLGDAVRLTFDGFFGRAYFGDGVLVGADSIDLEAQVWGLVSPVLPAEQSNALAIRVHDELDAPSPIGAPLWPRGDVWPAISGLLTWGYTRGDDERAFAHFERDSLAMRARAFPDVWHTIWSGPDGISSTTGQTWASPVTPMTDFPTMNNNVHAMALLAATRIAGIEPVAGGLVIQSHVPEARYAFVTRLVEVSRDGDVIRGRWRPMPNVSRRLVVRPPRGKALASFSVDGQAVPVAREDEVSVEIVARDTDGVGFEARLR